MWYKLGRKDTLRVSFSFFIGWRGCWNGGKLNVLEMNVAVEN